MKNRIVIVVIALLFVNTGLFFYVNNKVDKVVVIDVIRVFNDFKLKKDLEGRANKALSGYSSQIDSLTALLETAKQKVDEERFNKVTEVLYNLQQEAQEAYETSNKNINEQVWKRLNPLIDEYGKSNGYRLIIGANGMGTVLYQVDALDRTDAVIKFINKKYEEGDK